MARGLRYDTQLVWVLTLTFGIVFFDRNALAFLGEFVKRDLGLNNTQLGLLSSALSFTWALSGLVVGRIADATGWRKPILVAAIVIFASSSFLAGLSTSFVMLLGARLLMGASEGGIMPISQSLVVSETAAEKRGLNMGIMQNFGSNLFGSFAAPIVLVWVAEHFGWRTSMFVAGAPGLLCALLVMYFVLGWTFLPVFYPEHRHISSSNASILMSVLGVSATLGSFLVPGLSDRFGRKPIMIGFSFLGMLTPLAALYYQGPLWALGALLFIGWLASGVFPLFMATIPSETVPAALVATAAGLAMGLGEVFGGVGSPIIAGRAADAYGITAPLYIKTGLCFIAGMLSLFLRETAPAKAGAPALSPA